MIAQEPPWFSISHERHHETWVLILSSMILSGGRGGSGSPAIHGETQHHKLQLLDWLSVPMSAILSGQLHSQWNWPVILSAQCSLAMVMMGRAPQCQFLAVWSMSAESRPAFSVARRMRNNLCCTILWLYMRVWRIWEMREATYGVIKNLSLR